MPIELQKTGAVFYFAVALAGGVGALLRVWLSQLLRETNCAGIPVATISVNVLGSFLIGFLSIWLTQKLVLSPASQMIIIAGVLGGFTTFSAFSMEALRVLDVSGTAHFAIYLFSSVGFSIMSCALGLLLAQKLL